MKKFGLWIFVIPRLVGQSFSPCDINHDGVVNVVDVQIIINQVLGASACTADLDQDGKCDVVDLQRVINAALGGSCVSSGSAATASIAITSPPFAATIFGTYSLSVDVSNAPATTSVEYTIGSLSLGTTTTPPFTQSWNTGFAPDGNYALLATARDAKGGTLATAEAVININNHSGAMTVNSPNLANPLSGAISLSLTGTDPGTYYPAEWQIFVDGVMYRTAWTDQAGTKTVTTSASLDTTKFLNGKHELNVVVLSDFWPAGEPSNKSWYGYRVGLNRTFVTNNGHTFMDVAANYQHVPLHPGGSLALQCRELFTDGTSDLCSAPTWSSDNAAVAVSPTGVLTAGADEGFATVTLTEKGKSTQIYVWVMNSFNISHFSGSGQMLTTYQPGTSIFPVAPFVLRPWDVSLNPALFTEVKRAGINTLFSGFYMNPRSTTTSYSAWESTYDQIYGGYWKWAAANGFHLYTMGDEICRGIGAEGWWTLNWPSGQQAVQHAMASLASSGVAIGTDIIDEGSMMWGGTPTPFRRIGETNMFTSVVCSATTCTVNWPNNPVKPGRFFAGLQFAFTGSVNPALNTPAGQMFTAINVTSSSFQFMPAGTINGTFTASNDPNLEFLWWAGSAGGCPSAPCTPPVPNTALLTVATWLRSASQHIPISWPALGVAPPSVHDSWAGKNSQVSDYMSHYWDSYQAGRTYAWGSGVAERVFWMRNAFYSRQRLVNFSRPQIILDSVSSYMYRKETPGAAFYTPPADTLEVPGTTPAAVVAGMMTAAAVGNSGVRLYQFEPPGVQNQRAKQALGTELQTGASPLAAEATSQDLWKALGYAANLLTKTLQPFILGTVAPSPALGSNIVTAVRQSASGTMVLAINATDWDRSLVVDLTPYRAGNAITRYTVGYKGITSVVIPDTASDSLILKKGQAGIWLFPVASTMSYLSSNPIPTPSLPGGAAAAILHYAYIYSQDLDSQTDGADCTSGCSLALDRGLGDVFYQFFFVDNNGTLVAKSSVNLIPGN